jgi:hypothetical protein
MVRDRLGLVPAAWHAAVLPAGARRRKGSGEDKQRQQKMDIRSDNKFHICYYKVAVSCMSTGKEPKARMESVNRAQAEAGSAKRGVAFKSLGRLRDRIKKTQEVPRMCFHPTNRKVTHPCDIDLAHGPILFDFYCRTGVLSCQVVASFPLRQT